MVASVYFRNDLKSKTVAGFGIIILIGIAIAKIIGTAFTVGSGGSGGVFGPALLLVLY